MDAEPQGFAQFVVARQRALQRTAVLLTGDWALAEDLVQTALVRSWPRWERISGPDDPEVYVRRVMVNTWATWWRRRWRGEQASAAVPEGPEGSDVAAEVAVRMVVRVFDDLSEAQVAEVLGCAVGTVKSTMARAVARRARIPGWGSCWSVRPDERDGRVGQEVAGSPGCRRGRAAAPV